ncbi:MAG: hypothetical protein WCJ66_10570 [Verrucomicrobiota bacterium]
MSNNETGMRKPLKPQVSLVAKIKAQLIAAKARKSLSFDMLAQNKREVEEQAAEPSTREALMDGGVDPAFALYASVQQMVSLFARVLLELPDLRTFSKRLEKLDSDYVPGFPPMSPVTESHFSMWTQCDLRVGEGSETMAGIFAEIGDVFGFGADYLALAKALANSRMGIYEHFGLKRGRACLRELVTDKEISFVGCTGYVGSKGELWFVRALPPPLSFHYWVGMGTPYVLRAPGRFEWLALFERNGIRRGELGMEQRLWQFLKFGPRLRYWSELIFEGYCGHNSGAVFLQGLPDVPESRLHSVHFNPNYALA